MPFHFSAKSKIWFYARYLFDKLVRIWFDVKRPKWRFFWVEFFYSFGKLVPFVQSFFLRVNALSFAVTRFGSFHLRPHTHDPICASPAFERLDVDELLARMNEKIGEGKRLLFLDVGADIGTYTVAVGNAFRASARVHIAAFEPMGESRRYFEKNILTNQLNEMVRVYPFALSDRSGTLTVNENRSEPGSTGIAHVAGARTVSIPCEKLDNLDMLSTLYDEIFVKLDVEGAERSVIEGAERFFRDAKHVTLLVEDFIDPRIISFLESEGFVFSKKVTTYNSWWEKARV